MYWKVDHVSYGFKTVEANPQRINLALSLVCRNVQQPYTFIWLEILFYANPLFHPGKLTKICC